MSYMKAIAEQSFDKELIILDQWEHLDLSIHTAWKQLLRCCGCKSVCEYLYVHQHDQMMESVISVPRIVI